MSNPNPPGAYSQLNNWTPTPLIRQGHGLSRATFGINLNYVGAVIIGPIIIFVLGLASWIFVFWMTGLSLRFCRPKCGKLMLECCIVNRQKNPQREPMMVLAINICLALGFITNMLSFIGNVSLDKAFVGFNNHLSSFNNIFLGQMQPAANAMYQQTLKLQLDFALAYPTCSGIGKYLFKVNSFVANTDDLQGSIRIIANALSYVSSLMVTGLQAKNALFYTIWIFLLVSIVLLKIFQSMKTCGRGAKTAIMAFVITTFFLILLGCFVFMLTASGASDICMNPTQSAISILPSGGGTSNQTAQAAFQFYSTCTGNDPIGNQVKTTYDNIAYLNTSFQYQYRYTNCFRQQPILTMLTDLTNINRQFAIIDRSTFCFPVQKIWLDLQNTLCTDLFTGAYALWLTMLFATVFVYCAFLLAAVDQYERVLDFSEYLDQVHGDLQEFDGVKPEDLIGDEEIGRRSPGNGSVFGSQWGGSVRSGGSQHGRSRSRSRSPARSVNSDTKATSLSNQHLFTSPPSSNKRDVITGALLSGSSERDDHRSNPLNTPHVEGKDYHDDNCTSSATPPTPEHLKNQEFTYGMGTTVNNPPSSSSSSPASSNDVDLVPLALDRNRNPDKDGGITPTPPPDVITAVRKTSAVLKVGNFEIAPREKKSLGEVGKPSPHAQKPIINPLADGGGGGGVEVSNQADSSSMKSPTFSSSSSSSSVVLPVPPVGGPKPPSGPPPVLRSPTPPGRLPTPKLVSQPVVLRTSSLTNMVSPPPTTTEGSPTSNTTTGAAGLSPMAKSTILGTPPPRTRVGSVKLVQGLKQGLGPAPEPAPGNDLPAAVPVSSTGNDGMSVTVRPPVPPTGPPPGLPPGPPPSSLVGSSPSMIPEYERSPSMFSINSEMSEMPTAVGAVAPAPLYAPPQQQLPQQPADYVGPSDSVPIPTSAPAPKGLLSARGKKLN